MNKTEWIQAQHDFNAGHTVKISFQKHGRVIVDLKCKIARMNKDGVTTFTDKGLQIFILRRNLVSIKPSREVQ